MNCSTCGRPDSECQCTAARMWLDELGLFRDVPPNATHRTHNHHHSTLFMVTCNVLALAVIAAVSAGGRLAWVWWSTR